MADPHESSSSKKALTQFDPRRPGLPPVIVLHAPSFAGSRAELESTLVHELLHAWLWSSIGLEHDFFPGWLAEGLARAYAGELDDAVWISIAWQLVDGSDAALTPELWQRATLHFGEDEPGGRTTELGVFLTLLLADAAGGEGVQRFVAKTQGGSSWRAALRSVTGMSYPEFRRAARERVRSVMLERWRSALPHRRELSFSGERHGMHVEPAHLRRAAHWRAGVSPR